MCAFDYRKYGRICLFGVPTPVTRLHGAVKEPNVPGL